MRKQETLGFGLGLRSDHYAHILEHQPAVDWFEIISENYLYSKGRPKYMLEQIAERYPIAMHGVSLSIGSSDPLNRDYLLALKNLAEDVQARWVSDHLCWTMADGVHSHALIPLPLNENTLNHVAFRVLRVQDILERPLILENPSHYMAFNHGTMTEPEFLSELVARTGCGLLLDVNNVFVSSVNLGFDPKAYLAQFPLNHVAYVHLAGHTHMGDHIIDTHDGEVSPEVWELYDRLLARTGPMPTLLEWDDKLPPFPELLGELEKARARYSKDLKPVIKDVDQDLARPIPVDAPDQPRLAKLQSELLKSIRLEQAIDPCLPWIQASPSLDGSRRMRIYQRDYELRLLRTMRNLLPGLCHLLQPQLFDDFALAYLKAYPSKSETLAHLDHFFVAWLEETKPEPGEAGPSWAEMLIETARVEHVLRQVSDAPCPVPSTMAGSEELLLEKLLVQAPGFQLLSLHFQIPEFLQAVYSQEDPGSPQQEDLYLAIYREAYDVRFLTLDRDYYQCLMALASGDTINQVMSQFQLETWHRDEILLGLNRLCRAGLLVPDPAMSALACPM